MTKFLLLLTIFSVPMALADSPLNVSATTTNSAGNSATVTSDKTGVLPMVSAGAGETLAVQVQFPATFANTALAIQPLDGGSVPGDNYDLTFAADGTGSFAFKVGAQNGLYRVALVSGSTTAMLQFWVPDPSTQSTNAAAVTP